MPLWAYSLLPGSGSAPKPAEEQVLETVHYINWMGSAYGQNVVTYDPIGNIFFRQQSYDSDYMACRSCSYPIILQGGPAEDLQKYIMSEVQLLMDKGFTPTCPNWKNLVVVAKKGEGSGPAHCARVEWTSDSELDFTVHLNRCGLSDQALQWMDKVMKCRSYNKHKGPAPPGADSAAISSAGDEEPTKTASEFLGKGNLSTGQIFGDLFGAAVSWVFIANVMGFVGRLVTEREEKRKEGLRMIGCSDFAYYGHWIIYAWTTGFVYATFTVITFFGMRIFTSGFVTFYLICLVFFLNLALVSFVYSCFLGNAFMGQLMTLVIYTFTCSISIIPHMPGGDLLMLFPQYAFGKALGAYLHHEATRWSPDAGLEEIRPTVVNVQVKTTRCCAQCLHD
ncbi:ABCA5 [Symbiodinium microadriaticum]|nr:ABCA5 [Symbiodinium microadriaticum]